MAFSPQDSLYLQRAAQLALRSQGSQYPNPQVGAVIVHQNRILGEGYHAKAGQAHAEVQAVKSVQPQDLALLPQATIYVTLEPCFHYGRTPPCVQLILQHRFKRVVIGQADPFPQVAGQSIQHLINQGVEVCLAPPLPFLQQLHARFFTNVQKQRPYVILKWAQSQDGFIARPNEQTKISNALSQILVHRWRSEEAAILVGSQTALTDNPQLLNRLYTPLIQQQPLRLVLDRRARLAQHPELQLFQQQNQFPSLWFSQTTQTHPCHKQLPADFSLQNWLQYLHQALKISSLFVEGGSQLLQSFVDAQVWDELRRIQAPISLQEGIKAPHFSQTLQWHDETLGNNLLSYAYAYENKPNF